ncbi:phosphatidylglycerol--membrane-oligosaccharide glycerophosphotransferase [Ligilactobacillus salivarius]|uniref:Phosphatidylglycerol--membrane-oligosaccharide glycerophosphotransferase n=1 Tax=Ligilactobacillus salivarius TaxID=1624 RepID=A0A1V9R9D2_9LACO|nr:LTA synthase family protein [Ligilactobacillus salivarius]OQQ89770.1 phosphatidylglycerol--membrane-oligosaccharide glycerophosphotransferase [Ligilactobacillus salivarius]
MIKKLCNTLMVYVAMVIVTFSLLVTQANPTFLQSNLLSEKLFAYSLLNNFSNVIIGVLLILIGYQIKGDINLIKKYIYIYIVNLLVFIGLFLWTRSFNISNLYDAVLPITRNTYPIVIGTVSALLIKDKVENWIRKYKLSVILEVYITIFLLPSLFNKDIFGLGNGNNIITAFLLTTLGIILANIEKSCINKKVITLMIISVILNITLALSMPYISLRIHKNLSTAYRFNSLTSITVGIMAIIIFVIVKKLKVIKININISEYTGLLALLVYSNNFIIEKTVNGDTNLKILFFKSFIVSITIIILGWILSKIDKKEYTLEKKLLLNDKMTITSWISKITVKIINYIKQHKFNLLNIAILYILAYCSFIFMSPHFTSPHMDGESYTSIFFYAFFIKQNMLLLNFLLYYLIYKFIYGITNKFWLSSIITYVITAVAIVADAIKIYYRSEPIFPTEVTMVSAYGDILSMVPKPILWITIVVLTILIVFIIFCETKVPQRKLNWKSRLLSILVAIVVFGSSTRINHWNSIVSKWLSSYGNDPAFWNQEWGVQQNGALQQFLNNIDTNIMESSESYSRKKVNKIAEKYERQARKINKDRSNNLSTQTIVFNLSESLANPNRLKGVELSKNPLLNIDNIKKNTTSGLMISSGLGGGTANMEYMTLTGLPVSNFSPTIATPYTQVVPNSSQTLTINNYFKKSTAIHPYRGSFYSREVVYKKFGFQRFMYLGSKYKINHKIKIGTNPYVSDETAYQNTLDVINGYKNGQFINLVTMQNHMPYSDYYDNSGDYQVNGDMDDSEKNTISNYSAGISYTDRAVQKFIEQIDKINKPITVVFYGDHLPGIYSNIDGNSLEARETDYFIYSNKYARQHGAKNLKHVKYVSPIDFIALTAEQTNSKVSPYYALLTEIQKELPTIKVYAYNNGKNPVFVDKKGKTIKYKQLTRKQKRLYNDLKLVQYDLTAGNQYLYKTKFFNVTK